MNQDQEKLERAEQMLKIIRGLARGGGVMLFILMLVSAILQGGLDRLIELNGVETLIFVCILTMFFGIIWAYQNEIAGGILIIIAYVVMSILLKSPAAHAIYPAFLILGILNVYLGVTESRLKRRNR